LLYEQTGGSLRTLIRGRGGKGSGTKSHLRKTDQGKVTGEENEKKKKTSTPSRPLCRSNPEEASEVGVFGEVEWYLGERGRGGKQEIKTFP